jgi:hypothetical protein
MIKYHFETKETIGIGIKRPKTEKMSILTVTV